MSDEISTGSHGKRAGGGNATAESAETLALTAERTPTAGPQVRPGPIFALLVLIQFMVVLDAGIVNIALPAIQRDLGLDAVSLAWIVDAYLLTFGGFLLLGGRAADLVGRRRMFLFGLALFTIASLACGLSTAAWQLLAARAAQGLGAALVSPAALALVTDLFAEGPRRNRALGIWGSMGGIAGAAGVLLGGLLTAAAWQWVFFINVPIGLAVLVLSSRMLPVGERPAKGTVGVVDGVTGTAGLCLLIVALVRGGTDGWADSVVVVVGSAGIMLLAFFVGWQRGATSPLLPRPLLRAGPMFANGLNALVGVVLFAMFFIVTLYLQLVLGYSPLMAGLIYLPVNVAMLIGAQAAPYLVNRLGPPYALAAGFVVQAAGLAWWAAVLDGGEVFSGFVAPMSLWCLGLGVSVVAAFVLCTNNISADIAGSAAGLVTTTLNIGGAIGLALLVTVAEARTAALTGDAAIAPAVAHAAGYRIAALYAVAICILAALLTLFAARQPVKSPADRRIMKLRGKTSIVTGASRGIGRAIAERLGQDGSNVIVHYNSNADAAAETVKSVIAAGGQAVAVQGDVAVPADIRVLYERAGSEFGGVDIVVNNAAMVVGGPFVAITEDVFDQVVAVNLRSVFVSGQEASKHVADGGRVINISAGLPATAIAMLGAYGATKAGVEVLTRSLAHQLGARGITVNAVAPGPTDTDMLAPDARANLDAIIGQTPLGRLGKPADVASVVAFLASAEAAWVTGQTIHVDGGFN